MSSAEALLIRADASAEIGTGHVMRCLALAQAWREAGGPVAFRSVACPDGVRARVTSAGIPVDVVSGEIGSSEDAWRSAREAATRGAWLVIDGYRFGPDFVQSASSLGVPVLAIEDHPRMARYDVDALLCQSTIAGRLGFDAPAYTLRLFGPAWALLRGELAGRVAPPARERGSHVVLTMGGADPEGATTAALRSIAAHSKGRYTLDVVIGAASANGSAVSVVADEVTRSSAGRISALTKVTPANFLDLIACADLVVTAGGGTVWEVGAMGVPCLGVPIAPNQVPILRDLERLGVAAVAEVEDVGREIDLLLADRGRRESMTRSFRAIVDTGGAQRAAVALRASREPADDLLRLARRDDAGLLWLWANDPEARANSFHQEPIPWDRHRTWLDAKLSCVGTRLYVLERRGVPVGVVRYEKDGNEAEVSFAVAPGHRGAGIGRMLLSASLSPARADLGVARVFGRTLPDNEASKALFRRAGFHETATGETNDRPWVRFEMVAR